MDETSFKTYFERDSIEYLQKCRDVERVMIVTDHAMVELGFLDRIIEQLDLRRNKVVYQIFADVEPDPDITTVERGTEIMRAFKPDTIVALGGGSPMDAAKVMWLFYEQPEVDFRDLVQKFMDIRKRAFKFPLLGKKTKFIAIPTTSGTGSEVTPFAVISDKANNRKYPIADYSLTPTVAIVDPALVLTVPGSVAADTGMDVLTHATEAYVSQMASDYTDGLALQAIKLVFENLESSVKNADFHSREKMHNASTIAGMAFANAFLVFLTQWPTRSVRNSTPSTDGPMRSCFHTLSATTVHAQPRQLHGLSTTTTVQMKNTKISLVC